MRFLPVVRNGRFGIVRHRSLLFKNFSGHANNPVSKEVPLNGDRALDVRMRFVTHKLEILEFEIEDVFDVGVHVHFRKREEIAGKLFFHLFQMVRVDMRVAERMDEIAGFQAAHLRDHHGEQSVRSYVEWHAEEDIGGALVKLAR